MTFKKEDMIIAIVGLLIIIYTLWYLLAHSPEFVSYSDLFTIWGGTLAFLGLFLNRLYASIDKLEGKISANTDRLEGKINNLIKEFSYIKGLRNRKKR
jgi:hypothetical protein